MITALLSSVNYSDYLKVALPHNTLQFDQIIVITTESDKECQDICSEYSNVKCIVVPDEASRTPTNTFSKGALTNKGFEYLNEIGYSDWLVSTDADIIFPKNFKDLLLSREKDPNILYGMKRRFCSTLKRFNEYLNTKNISFCTIGDRMSSLLFNGYCQIFIYSPNKFVYSDTDTVWDDLWFLSYFSESIKQSVAANEKKPNLWCKPSPTLVLLSTTDFVVHLGPPSINWHGRTSEPFG